jgi:hypothetical protein
MGLKPSEPGLGTEVTDGKAEDGRFEEDKEASETVSTTGFQDGPGMCTCLNQGGSGFKLGVGGLKPVGFILGEGCL